MQGRVSRSGLDRFVTERNVLGHFVFCFFDVSPVGVSIDEDRGAAPATQKIVDRRIERFALDVPQRHVDRRNRRHGNRAAAPVCTTVEVLPDVLALE